MSVSRDDPIRFRRSALRRAFQAWWIAILLRTTIAVHAGKPVQQIHEHHLVHFELTDTPAWRDDALQTRLVEETQRPSILNEGRSCE